MKLRKLFFFLVFFLMLTLRFCTFSTVYAQVKTSDLETTAWTQILEASIIDTTGQLQSMCATDNYIVCLVNANRTSTSPDTLIAFYRNDTDPNGNPVQQYSYAFHVTETDYEHGNGMTYNPNTQEIAIAGLFTNDPSNAGAVFLVDANTLRFKQKVQVGNGSMNYFGISYVPEKDQYVLMANRIADYAFVFTDSAFQITEILNFHLSHSRSSFQDFCVAGDAIISIPYMQRDGYMNIMDIYSISRKQRIGSYYLTLPGHDAFDVEPEGICELEPGHFLMASIVKNTTNLKLYEINLPLAYNIDTSVENGTISDSGYEILQGQDFSVSYECPDGFRLKSVIVDGQEENILDFPSEYTFQNIQTNHIIQVLFEEIPRYTVTTLVTNGQIQEASTGLEHESLTILFSPDAHYEIDAILVDDLPVSFQPEDTSYTFDDLDSNHTLEVRYRPIPQYTITIKAEHADLSSDSAIVYRDSDYIVEAFAHKGYVLGKCLLDGQPADLKVQGNHIILENIQQDHTLTLIYKRPWLPYLLGVFIVLFLFTFFLLIQQHKRKKQHKKRQEELRRIREEQKEFYQNLSD